MRVVKVMTLPIELPAKAAAKGPFRTSTRAIAFGDTRPHLGEAEVLLLPISEEISIPST